MAPRFKYSNCEAVNVINDAHYNGSDQNVVENAVNVNNFNGNRHFSRRKDVILAPHYINLNGENRNL